MKNSIIAGAVVLASLSLATFAHADLEGDLIDGAATGLTTFGPSSTTVVFDFDPEFSGTQDLYGDGSVNFTTDFTFYGDSLFLTFGHDISGSTQFMTDFSVTFSDLDYLGSPNFVLTDVTSISDTLSHDQGAGLSVLFGDHSLTLSFTNFEVENEFREIELGLVFDESGGPNTPVVPVPAALPLGALGMVAVALKRKFF